LCSVFNFKNVSFLQVRVFTASISYRPNQPLALRMVASLDFPTLRYRIWHEFSSAAIRQDTLVWSDTATQERVFVSALDFDGEIVVTEAPLCGLFKDWITARRRKVNIRYDLRPARPRGEDRLTIAVLAPLVAPEFLVFVRATLNNFAHLAGPQLLPTDIFTTGKIFHLHGPDNWRMAIYFEGPDPSLELRLIHHLLSGTPQTRAVEHLCFPALGHTRVQRTKNSAQNSPPVLQIEAPATHTPLVPQQIPADSLPQVSPVPLQPAAASSLTPQPSTATFSQPSTPLPATTSTLRAVQPTPTASPVPSHEQMIVTEFPNATFSSPFSSDNSGMELLVALERDPEVDLMARRPRGRPRTKARDTRSGNVKSTPAKKKTTRKPRNSSGPVSPPIPEDPNVTYIDAIEIKMECVGEKFEEPQPGPSGLCNATIQDYDTRGRATRR